MADVHVHVHMDNLPNKEDFQAMIATMERLVKEVEETRTVQGSAITLISGLRTEIGALAALVASTSADPAIAAKIDELSTSLDEGQASLAAALAANTPAAPVADVVLPADPAAAAAVVADVAAAVADTPAADPAVASADGIAAAATVVETGQPAVVSEGG